MNLRPYQRRVCATLWDFWNREDGAALAVLPTGAGKTVVAQAIVHEHLKHVEDGHVLFVTHLTEVIRQTAARFAPAFAEVGVATGVWCASLGEKNWQPVTVASVQSLASLAELPGTVTMVVLDECHGIPADQDSMYGALLRRLPANTDILGLTATPWRLDGGEIWGPGKLFRHVTARVEIEELIAAGHLVRPRMSGSSQSHTIDTKGVPMTGGDYNQGVLSVRATEDGLVQRQVDDAMGRLRGREQVVWFAVDIAHAEAIAAEINRRDCSAATVVHSQMPRDERDNRIRVFTRGGVRHIVNVNVLTEGWDCPAVDAIVLLRPTKSPARYVQMVGRGLRPADGKEDCLVLDYAGIVKELGPITDPVVVTKNTAKGQQGRSPLKMCPKCFEYVGLSTRACPECQYEWPERDKRFGFDRAFDGDLMGKEPERRRVSKITMGAHTSKQGNSCLRLTYHHGLGSSTTEYLMFAYPSAADKARGILAQLGVPNARQIMTVGQAIQVAEAAARAGDLPDIDHILVTREGQYDRVISRKQVAKEAAYV